MKNRFIDDWIRGFLDEGSMRAKSLIITIYGDFIAPHGGTVWLGSFIRLVEPLGLNSRVVRTSVFRLSRDGWLTAEQIGRRSYYSLTNTGRRRFEHAYRRIYYEPSVQWDGDWQIVLTNTGNLSAPQRSAVCKELLWEGFGAIAPGVLAHPSSDTSPLLDILTASRAQDELLVLRARSLNPFAAKPLQQLVTQCWDLAAIAQNYVRFTDRFRPVLDALEETAVLNPEQCFIVRTLLLHEFRRVLLRDPQLPPQLLPPDWPGAGARKLCRALYLVTQQPAEAHLESMLETPTGRLPKAAPYYFERFGGLSGGALRPSESLRAG